MKPSIVYNIRIRFDNVDLSTLCLSLSQFVADYMWGQVVIMQVISWIFDI